MHKTNNVSKSFQKDRLRLARLAKCTTQVELADQIGVTRQYIHQFESGDRNPSADTIDAFAALLDVHPHYFFKPIKQLVTDEDVNFRKQFTTKKQFENQMIAKSTLLREIIEFVNKNIEIPKASLPELRFSTPADIERAAQAVRSHLDLGENSPIDSVTRVLEVSGILCINSVDVPTKISALSVDLEQPFVIHNSSHTQETRFRSSLSHEIAHLVGHRGILTGDKKTEGEADKFAALFLVPSRAFRLHCPLRGKGRINWSAMREFKKEWKISYRAIIKQAYELDMIDAAVYKSANIHLSANGYSKSEPHEPEESSEQPELFSQAFTLLREHLNVYMDDFIEATGLSAKFLNSLLGQTIESRPKEEKNVVSFRSFLASKNM